MRPALRGVQQGLAGCAASAAGQEVSFKVRAELGTLQRGADGGSLRQPTLTCEKLGCPCEDAGTIGSPAGPPGPSPATQKGSESILRPQEASAI